MKLTSEAKTLIGIGLATVVILLSAVFFLSKTSPSTTSETVNESLPVDTTQLIKADSYQTASASAKVTIVEFLDYECEACGAAHPILKKVMSQYPNDINFVVRHFPNHFNSIAAGRAAEAAGLQGKYWEMHNTLFEKQTTWSEKRVPQNDKFKGFAVEIGLDMEKFNVDFEKGEFIEKINRDKKEGISLGVDATPTFFINGVKAVGVLSEAEWKEKIDAEINK